jgi:chemotaxis protein CheD
MMAQKKEHRSQPSTPLSNAINRRQSIYLQPGQLVATRLPTTVKTILGSCISVCLWDETSAVGGINHFLLPFGTVHADMPGRFGNLAVPMLIDALRRQGADVASMRAKVFGGASMIAGGRPRPTHVGMQNLNIAKELLANAGIPVISSDTGGARGRKIVFNTDTGEVSLWEL